MREIRKERSEMRKNLLLVSVREKECERDRERERERERKRESDKPDFNNQPSSSQRNLSHVGC